MSLTCCLYQCNDVDSEFKLLVLLLVVVVRKHALFCSKEREALDRQLQLKKKFAIAEGGFTVCATISYDTI